MPHGQRILTKEEWEHLKLQNELMHVVPARGGSSFRGLSFRPKGVSFATQNEGEKVFILLRRHWITNSSWTLSSVFYLTIPLIISFGAQLLGQDIPALLGTKVLIAVLLSYYAVIFTNTWRHFVDWYFNLYIVTDERVIDYDFKTFTSRGIAESTLDNVEDVREVSVGFLPNLFNYGDVSIFSAADKSVITFHHIPNPTLVRDKIADLSKITKRLHQHDD